MRDIVDHMFQNFFASIMWKEFGESHLMGVSNMFAQCQSLIVSSTVSTGC
jgi:hypothetical protein